MAGATRSRVGRVGTSAEMSDLHCANGSYIFANLDEIIERMLMQLPMQYLNVCARVCHRWNKVVQWVKKRRCQSYNIVWLNCAYEEQFAEFVAKKLQLMSSEPHTAIVFTSHNMQTVQLPKPRRIGQRKRRRKQVDLVEYLSERLPSQCNLIGTETRGVIVTSYDNSLTDEAEWGLEVSLLLIPSIPSVSIHRFSIDNATQDAISIPGDVCLPDLTGVPLDCRPKLMLLFCNPLYNDFGEPGIIDWLMSAYEGRTCIAGGFVDTLLPAQGKVVHSGDEVCAQGVIFCGEQLHVTSVMLDEYISTAAGIEAQLRRLSTAHLMSSRQQRIAFMFSCVGRGCDFYTGQTKMESGIFRKLYPSTPLFGFFGDGEIGCDFLPDPTDANFSVMVNKVAPIICHSYSSVFVMVTFPAS